jgi:hypothetical protein
MTEFKSKKVSVQIRRLYCLIRIVVLKLIVILLVHIIGTQWDVTCSYHWHTMGCHIFIPLAHRGLLHVHTIGTQRDVTCSYHWHTMRCHMFISLAHNGMSHVHVIGTQWDVTCKISYVLILFLSYTLQHKIATSEEVIHLPKMCQIS